MQPLSKIISVVIATTCVVFISSFQSSWAMHITDAAHTMRQCSRVSSRHHPHSRSIHRSSPVYSKKHPSQLTYLGRIRELVEINSYFKGTLLNGYLSDNSNIHYFFDTPLNVQKISIKKLVKYKQILPICTLESTLNSYINLNQKWNRITFCNFPEGLNLKIDIKPRGPEWTCQLRTDDPHYMDALSQVQTTFGRFYINDSSTEILGIRYDEIVIDGSKLPKNLNLRLYTNANTDTLIVETIACNNGSVMIHDFHNLNTVHLKTKLPITYEWYEFRNSSNLINQTSQDLE